MTRIGLLSDSHGHAPRTARAAQVLADAGAEMLIHLGDVGTTEVLDALLVNRAGQSTPLPVQVTFGNTDWNHRELAFHARRLELTVGHPLGAVELPEGSLVYSHGDQPHLLTQAAAQGARWLCHGHTHLQRDEHLEPGHWINPGALMRASQYTVALLDTATDQVRFLPIPSTC